MKSVTCAQCGVRFDMTNQLEASRREDHNPFYCPNGHSQYFPGKTAQEKKIDELEKQLQKNRDFTSGRFRELIADRDEAQRAARRCPLCGDEVAARMRVRENIVKKLADHLRYEHGAVERRRAIEAA